MPRSRLDKLVVDRGLAPSREKAQALILAGDILVNGQTVRVASAPVADGAEIELVAPLKYVSRGGLKLEAALDAFGVDPAGRVCADVGASTGGFTDCLLQRGAVKVFALDVGRGQLHNKLRQDPRVISLEKTNVRHLEALDEPVSLVTIDVSFISLSLILPPVVRWLARPAEVLAMVKPQFEAGPRDVGKGGVVRDPAVRIATIQHVSDAAATLGLATRGVCPSPISGPAGNREYFLWLVPGLEPMADIPAAIARAVTGDTAVV